MPHDRTPVFLPPKLFDAAKRDPRFKEACERGDYAPTPLIPVEPDAHPLYDTFEPYGLD